MKVKNPAIITLGILLAVLLLPSCKLTSRYQWDYWIKEVTPEVQFMQLQPKSELINKTKTDNERLQDAISSWTIQLNSANKKIISISIVEQGAYIVISSRD